jgi:hypothetical protein
MILGETSADSRLNVVKGKVTSVAHLGSEIHYDIQLTSGQVVLVFEHNRDQALFSIGTPLRLGFRPNDEVLISKGVPVVQHC